MFADNALELAKVRALFSDETSSEDRDQQIKCYLEVIDCLLDGGYHRVHVKSLTPFDKVIGGLCWAIASCGIGVDVNFLFEDNLPLGRKIELSEAVVETLRAMACPHRLMAHNIQGHDFASIHPIISWLIVKVKAYRLATGFQTRDSSLLKFEQSYAALADELMPSDEYIDVVMRRYRPSRKLRRSAGMWNAAQQRERLRVNACLLEFGERVGSMSAEDIGVGGDGGGGGGGSGGGGNLSAFEKKFKKAMKASGADAEAQAAQEREFEEQMLAEMAKAAAGGGGGVAANLAGIVGLQSDAISRAKKQYADEAEKLRKETEDSAPRTARGRAAAFARQEAALVKRVEIAQQALDAAEAANEEVATRVAAIQKQIGTVEKYTAKVQKMIGKLEVQENSGPHKESLAALKKLVLLNEQLKAQDSAFRAGCAKQKAELEERITTLRAGGASPEEAARLLEIDEMHDDVLSKYNKGRTLLGRKGQEISAMARRIDDIPTRTELIQYERRFVELYELVSLKLEETRKYFTTYNTLNETRDYHDRETRLIGSIKDGALQAKSRGQKEALSKSAAVRALLVLLASCSSPSSSSSSFPPSPLPLCLRRSYPSTLLPVPVPLPVDCGVAPGNCRKSAGKVGAHAKDARPRVRGVPGTDREAAPIPQGREALPRTLRSKRTAFKIVFRFLDDIHEYGRLGGE